MKQQLVIHRSRQRAPNLSTLDMTKALALYNAFDEPLVSSNTLPAVSQENSQHDLITT
jgi:hypothetical protein